MAAGCHRGAGSAVSARDDYSKTFFEDDDWYDKAMDELDRLRAEVKLVRPVIEAAKSCRCGC